MDFRIIGLTGRARCGKDTVAGLLVEEFDFQGGPTQADLEHGEGFGAAFARAVRSAGS